MGDLAGCAFVDPQFVGVEVAIAVGDVDAEYAEHRAVEAAGGGEVADFQVEMVDQAAALDLHGGLLVKGRIQLFWSAAEPARMWRRRPVKA